MTGQMTNKPAGRGFIADILTKIRLTISLVKDARVPVWLKAIPILSLLYLIVPIDLLIGPIDDALIIYIGMDLFIDLCPPEIVAEYLQRQSGQGSVPKEKDMVDGEFKD